MDHQQFMIKLFLHRLRYAGIVLISESVFMVQAHAQKTTDGMEGTITGPSGAVVPKAND